MSITLNPYKRIKSSLYFIIGFMLVTVMFLAGNKSVEQNEKLSR
jgi:hypothetical protein